MSTTLVTFDKVDWSDLSTLKDITCVNHTGAKYLSKNPYIRSLHFIAGDPKVGLITECPCPFGDLRVVIGR